jgi:amidophosphoribosyltransferase
MIDLIDDKFKEECGVFGVFSKNNLDVARITYYGLYALQHRGQESAGIATSNGKEITLIKNLGLVTEAFNESDLDKLKGNIAIGHVRYSTCGANNVVNAQPLFSSTKLGNIAVAHNGTLVNADVIKDLLEDSGCIFHTTIDSEVIISLIARNAKSGIEKAVFNAVQAIRGSFAMVILTQDQMIGVRDPHGIRPLCIGKIDDSYIFTSESCALDTVGAEYVRDVEPGEIVIISDDGMKSFKYSEQLKCETCAFEYIYFARPDSTIDGINVHKSRVRAGEMLAKQSPVEADVVIGVPDSGLASAIGYSKVSGIPFDTGFVKNRYVGRTFITPNQEMRERAVSVKLNPLKEIVEGKRVILIDDSIVRGTTSKHLIESLRRAGATEVHFRIASPIVKFPCYFGIDTPYRSELIGANCSVEEIRQMIGADSLDYLTIDNLLETFGEGKGFCLGCFKGVYPVSTPIEIGKDHLER